MSQILCPTWDEWTLEVPLLVFPSVGLPSCHPSPNCLPQRHQDRITVQCSESALWPVQTPEEPSRESSERWSWVANSASIAWIPSGQACANLKNGLMVKVLRALCRPQRSPGKGFGDTIYCSILPSTSRCHQLRISNLPLVCPSVLHICICHFGSPLHGCSQPAGPSPFFPECSPRTAPW